MLSNETVNQLAKLAHTTDQLALGLRVQRQQVEQARQAGASWSSIANIMGITRQAVRQRYAPRPEARTLERLF